MGQVFDNAYAPDPATRADRLASPAHRADTADLTGIAPALVITPELDRLHDEGIRYARRPGEVGALVEHWDIPQADHGYDMDDLHKARQTYASIARHITSQPGRGQRRLTPKHVPTCRPASRTPTSMPLRGL
jgi:acetyl esterase